MNPSSLSFSCPVLLLKWADSEQVPAEAIGKLGWYPVGQGPARTQQEGKESHVTSVFFPQSVQSCDT